MKNQHEIFIGDKKYLSLKQASKISGYAKDYIGYLCRVGKVEAKRFGHDWFVSESALNSYKQGDEIAENVVQNLSTEKAADSSERNMPMAVRGFWKRMLGKRAVIVLTIIVLLIVFFTANDIITSRKSVVTDGTTPKISPAEQLALQQGTTTDSQISPVKWDITSADLVSLKTFIISELKDSGLVTNTIIEKPTIIERAVERVVSGLTREDLDVQLNIINNKLLAQVADLKNLIATRSDQNFSAIALTNKIDNLSGTTLSNVTFLGSVSGLTDAHIPDSITASNYLPLSGGTITGDLVVTGTCTGCGIGVPDWQKEINFGALSLTPTTTIPIWSKDAIYASSTLIVNGPASFNSITATSTLNVSGLSTFGNATATQFTVTGDAYFAATSGNVGIGTTSPYAKLSIHANATETTNTLFAVASSTASATTSLFSILNNGNVIVDVGNVGIGTTSPYAKLSVSGSGVFENNVLTSYFTATSTTATSTFMGAVGIGTTSPYAKLSVSGSGVFENNILASYFTATSTSNASVFPYASTTAITISGTASTTNLIVSNTSTFKDFIAVNSTTTNATSTNLAILATASTTDLIISGNATLSKLTAGSVIFAGTGGLLSQNNANFSWNDSATRLSFPYASSTSLTTSGGAWLATTGGNVGIGTTSPYAKLSVHANATETNNTLFTVASSTASATTTHFVIMNNGNVGIGTTTPSGVFSVNLPNTANEMVLGLTASQWAKFKNNGTGGSLRIEASGATLMQVNMATSTNSGVSFTNQYSQINDFISVDGTNPTYFNVLGGNVGIGTASPGAPLHVAGTPSNQDGFDGYVQAGQLQLGVDESVPAQPMIITNGSGQDLHFGTFVAGVANKRLTILSGGNVGIGTAAPGHKLELLQGTTPTDFSDPMILIGGDGADSYAAGAIHAIGFNYSTGIIPAVAIGYEPTDSAGTTKGSLHFATRDVTTATAPSKRMTITSGGNIGIGTTSPYAKLSVHANATETANTLFAIASSTANATTTHFVITNTGNVGIGATTPWAKFTTIGRISSATSNFDTVAGTGGALAVDATTNYTTFKHFKNGDTAWGNLVFQPDGGNVGIGTASPTRKLQINDSTAGSYPVIAITNDGTGSTITDGMILGVDSDETVLLHNYEATNIRLTAANDQGLVINSSGNVGIGTTSPMAGLAVSAADTNHQIVVARSGSSVGYGFIGANANGLLVDAVGDGTKYLKLNSAEGLGGSVIVGTAPQWNSFETFQVNTSNTTAYTSDMGSGFPRSYGMNIVNEYPTPGINNMYTGITMMAGNRDGGVMSGFIGLVDEDSASTGFTGRMVFGTRNPGSGGNYNILERMAIDETGNVGIGTTSPNSFGMFNGPSLHMEGAVNSEPNLVLTRPNTNQTGILALTGTDSIRLVAVGATEPTYNALSFWTEDTASAYSPTERMRITSTGNVGIGTTSPSAKLSIKDTAMAVGSGIILQGNDDTEYLNLWQGGAGSVINAVGADTGYGMHFTTDGTERMTILASNGRVGIGVTGPLYKLHVDGGTGIGIYGVSSGSGNPGVYGNGPIGVDGNGTEYGVYASATGGAAYGIYCNSVDNVNGCGGNRNWYNASDARLKKNITSITGALEKVLKLRGVNYAWKTDEQSTNQIGFIAQEVLPIVPEVVGKGPDDYYALSYGAFTPLLVGAMQETVSILDIRNAATSSQTLLSYYSATGSPAIFVDAAGNIGIGTTTPNYKLTVQGEVAAQGFVNISTREAKKDIVYLNSSDEDSALEKIKTTNLATYNYNNEDCNSKLSDVARPTIGTADGQMSNVTCRLRLGLIAEEAPIEVLSVDGKGVDLYKMTSFAWLGLKAQEKKIDAMELRLSELERQWQYAAGATSTNTLPDAWNVSGGLLSTIASAFQDIGITISNGFVQAREFLAEKITAKKVVAEVLEMKDAATGDIYCLRINNGEWSKLLGVCTEENLSDVARPTNSAVEIIINGNNPAILQTHDIYGDLGAVASTTDQGLIALGVRTFQNGAEVAAPQIDTSTAGTYEIVYKIIDGNASILAEAIRTVIVEAPAFTADQNTATTTDTVILPADIATTTDAVIPPTDIASTTDPSI